jgi:hypothetical protein
VGQSTDENQKSSVGGRISAMALSPLSSCSCCFSSSLC